MTDYSDVDSNVWETWETIEGEAPPFDEDDLAPEEGAELGQLDRGEVEQREEGEEALDIDTDDPIEFEDAEHGDLIDDPNLGQPDVETTGTFETAWTDTVHDRADRLADSEADVTHGEVREYLRQSGTMQHLLDRLRDLGTVEDETTDSEGSVLDMRNVVRRLAGDTTVTDYYRKRISRPGDDVAVGVSIDMSGSMGAFEQEAKGAAGAFLAGVQRIGGEVVSNAFKGLGEAQAELVTSPYEDFRWAHLDSVWPAGGTPTDHGIIECAELLDETRSQNRLLVVVTDGAPSKSGRQDLDTSNSTTAAAETVDEVWARNMAVVGVGIGNITPRQMETIFGADGFRSTTVADLADELVDVLEEQMGSALAPDMADLPA